MNNSLLLHILVDVQYSSGQPAVPGACAGGYSNGARIIDGGSWYRCENGQKQGPIGCYFGKIGFNVGDNITVAGANMECQKSPAGGPQTQTEVKFRQHGCTTPKEKEIEIDQQYEEKNLRYECQPGKLVILACIVLDEYSRIREDVLVGKTKWKADINVNDYPDLTGRVIGVCEQHDDGSVVYDDRKICQLLDKDKNILASTTYGCSKTFQFEGNELVFKYEGVEAFVKPKEEGEDNNTCA